MDNDEYEGKISAMSQWAETVGDEIAHLITDKPAKILYHYTDVNGLIGLIETGCIWATHVSRLNDTSENKHGFKLVIEYVKNNLPKSSQLIIEKALLKVQSVDTYVACYSTKNNSLNQWRNYTGGRVGYSLGFETNQMATLDGKMPLLEQVIYEDGKAKALLDLLLQRVDDFLNTNSFGEVEVGYLIGTASSMLNTIACIIKHHKFQEESEYRHFFQPDRSNLKMKPFFRTGKYGLTPYVEIQFSEDKKLPLKNVTVGPCLDFDIEHNALKILLEKNGYDGVKILNSMIPLRVS
jgi:hypothetical protein